MQRMYSDKRIIVTLILPAVFTFLFAILVPICLSVYYGFTDSSGFGAFKMIGLNNYRELIHDSVFWVALANSALLALGYLCIQHPLAIVTAAILDKLGGKPENFFRCVYFIPNVITVAVIAYLWKFVYDPNFGLINNVAQALGFKGGFAFLGAGNALWSLLVVLIWHGFGWAMLIYYTGIKNIDPSLYEAASIDGCDGKQTFTRITLPLMKPVLRVNITIAVISALKQMEMVYLLTKGGPGNETQFTAYYLYKQAFTSYRYGYGNAISVAFVIICLLATVLLNSVFRRIGED